MASQSLPKALCANCFACPLQHSPFVADIEIPENPKAVIVGESPGATEVREGKPFVGASGDFLWRVMKKLGHSREDFAVTNAVLCQPMVGGDEKQDIMSAAVQCCKPRLDKWLSQTSAPTLLLGKWARESLQGPENGQDINTLHGRWEEVGDRLTLATYHPAFILRDPEQAKTFFTDVTKFFSSEVYPKFTPKIIVLHSGEPHASLPTNDDVVGEYVLADEDTITQVLRELMKCEQVSYDIETNQVDYREDRILALGLSGDGLTCYIFRSSVVYKSRNLPIWKEFWASKSVRFVGQNAKFDKKFLRFQLGWKPRNDFDTMIAHYVLDERRGTHGLKGLAAQYLDVPDYEVSISKYLSSKSDSYSKIPDEELWKYLAMDVCCTFRLVPLLERLLKASDMYEMPFSKMLMPLENILHEAEIEGVKVDVEYSNDLLATFENELAKIHSEIVEVAGYHIDNLNSSAQVKRLLFTHLKLPMQSGRNMKEGSTSKEALARLQTMHPVVPMIQKHRRVAKMKSSYLANVLEMLDDQDKVHCDFQIHGTETGRLSVTSPALQTIPRADEREDGKFGKLIKDMYISRPGYSFVMCDYSQAELRVAAALSGDEFLLGVYKDNRDLHSEVARRMFGEDFTKTQRVLCKMFNFSYLYGGNEYSFAVDAGLNIEVARQFVKEYDTLMPALAAWKNEQWSMMRTRGFVSYRTGRRRRIPYITGVNESDARKASFNSVTQGQASDLTNLSAIKIHESLSKTDWGKIVLLIHDSNVAHVKDAHIYDVAAIMKEAMTSVGREWFPEVTWQVDLEVGSRWGSVKHLEIN